MNKIFNFLKDRYGADQLSIALGVLGCIITFALSFIRVPYYRLIGLIPFVLIVIRALSKNFEARRKENERFLRIFIPWKNYIIKKQRQRQDKEHKYYDCPSCSHTLRVPKNRGKIEIICPYCSNKFKRNTGKKKN